MRNQGRRIKFKCWYQLHFCFISLFGFVTTISSQTNDSIQPIKAIDSMILVSVKLTEVRDFKNAGEVLLDAEQIFFNSRLSDSTILARIYTNIGRVYLYSNNYDLAEKYFLLGTEIFNSKQQEVDKYYCANLGSLGALYLNTEELDKAEMYCIKANKLLEIMFGKGHADYALNLSNLGRIYRKLGLFGLAEKCLLEALSLRKQYLGKENRGYPMTLNSLALLYKDMGDYQKAELMYVEAKSIREEVLGKSHIDYVTSLTNLAILYKNLGVYDKSEILFNEAREIVMKTKDRDFNDYSIVLEGLAVLYKNMHRLNEAVPLILESIEINKTKLGQNHVKYIKSCTNLALIYKALMRYGEADSLLQIDLLFEKNAFGEMHHEYAKALHNIGTLWFSRGDYEKALSYCYQAQDIRSKTIGTEHLHYAQSLDMITDIYIELGNYRMAILYNDSLSRLDKRFFNNAMFHLSELEMNHFIDKFYHHQSRTFTLALNQISTNNAVIQTCFDNVLYYKNLLLDSKRRMYRLSKSNSITANLMQEKNAAEYRLYNEYCKPILKRDSILLSQLNRKAEQLEKDLVQKVQDFSELTEQVYWRDIHNKLQDNEAIFEFVQFPYYNNVINDSIIYAVLILRKGIKEPLFIPLFEEKSLGYLLKSHTERKSDFVNQLYSFAYRGVRPIEEQRGNLCDLVWAPLEKHLQGVKKIYVSPSGLLHRINLNAIPVSETETIGDRYQIIALNSTRQLVIPGATNVNNQQAILYGGINYEPDSTFKDPMHTIASRSRGELSFNFVDSTLRGGRWDYLPGTEREIQALEKLLKSKSLTVTTKRGSLATEEFFKNIGFQSSSPRILHISSHGYFFPDPKKKVGSQQFPGDSEEQIFKNNEHPMLRSGLILAGGNAGWQGKQTLVGREDGVLTAYEISQMNLSNTELVVLSACETGLGDIKGNEGVYGLQRAFKIAGAKYLMMSLWQIPDQATKEFMISFYTNWLKKGKSIPVAFQDTQKEMQKRFLNPYSWAGFVLIQ